MYDNTGVEVFDRIFGPHPACNVIKSSINQMWSFGDLWPERSGSFSLTLDFIESRHGIREIPVSTT